MGRATLRINLDERVGEITASRYMDTIAYSCQFCYYVVAIVAYAYLYGLA